VVDAGGAAGCSTGSAGIGVFEAGALETATGVPAGGGDDRCADVLCEGALAATALPVAAGLRVAGTADEAGFGVASDRRGAWCAGGCAAPEGSRARISTDT
jgi:hypothetical protein